MTIEVNPATGEGTMTREDGKPGRPTIIHTKSVQVRANGLQASTLSPNPRERIRTRSSPEPSSLAARELLGSRVERVWSEPSSERVRRTLR